MLLISLVGEQPIPNLLPLWQHRRYTATQFAATATTWPVAEQLVAAMQVDPALKSVEILPHLRLEAYDLGQARRELSAAINQHQQAGRQVTMNLTGGTKLMSLAALQAAFGSGAALLYVATETGELIWMASDGAEQRREPIRVHIKVNQYLLAHGLNVLHRPHDSSKVGGLLEEMVYRQAFASGVFDDVQRNVTICKQIPHGQVKNELDVLVTRNGRLAVCSCKSGNVTKESIYELASLSRREAAGIYCGKLMVCEQDNLKPAIIERARAMNVYLVAGNDLANVAERLRQATEH